MSHIHIYKPSPSGASRTLLLLHGTGGDENSMLQVGQAVDPVANVLSVRGNVLEGSSNRFFRRIAEGVFDVEDLKRRTVDLADFLVSSSQEHGFSLGCLIALGYSNGANIAASLLLLRPEVLAGAILMRSMAPLDPPHLPNLIGKHILMLTGSMDPIVPLSSAEALETSFRKSGAEVQLELLRSGHDLTRRDIEIANHWLQLKFHPQ